MESNENSVGPVIGLIIILALIVLGGLYFWGARGKTADGSAQPASADSSITAQSSADDTTSIQSDLNNTNTETIDSQLNAS